MSQKLNNKIINEKKFSIELSLWEIALIVELRTHAFGTFEVFKADGKPVRIIRKETKLLKPESIIDNLDIANGKFK